MQKSLTRYWLLLGVVALAIAGLYSLVLVVARTPALAAMPLFAKLFHEALVVHVDLSVLVWFLSIACLMWSRLSGGAKNLIPYIEEAALICFGGGALMIAASPLDPVAEALMSNYIPVITSHSFFIGLSLLMAGIALMLIKLLTAAVWSGTFSKPQQFLAFSAGIITVIALAAFIWSGHQMPQVIDGQQFYELLFWGGGHVLQFTHTQILLLCWLLLAAANGITPKLNAQGVYALGGVGLLAAFATPFIYMNYSVESMQHREFFTGLMIAGNGIAPAVLVLFLLPGIIKTRCAPAGRKKLVWKSRVIPILISILTLSYIPRVLFRMRTAKPGERIALWSTLTMSVVLFIYGGILAGMIHGQNVVIPAHYHGSIVGITLGFMGAAYLFLPQLGYRDPASWRLAYWQPIVYGVGQLMHVSGLAYSGGYGVLRKTPGGMENVSMGVKAAMGFMGLGGLLAIIGGFMFVIVVAWAVFKRPSERAAGPAR